ncbi:MAG: hypothetical protein U9P14_06715 [Gemmatimonadota bacterium]|nr:hypothetical protein [Gemmatimonadota bacterium]
MDQQVPSIVFRCDGSFEGGLGHLARCTMLARELNSTGCAFIIRPDPAAEDFLRVGKVDFHILPGPYCPERIEAAFVAEIARRAGARIVIVDKKDNGAGFVKALKRAGLFVVDIEDRGDGRNWADILIDPHIRPGSSEEKNYTGSAFCGFGPGWVLLDPVYARLRHRSGNNKPASHQLTEVTVSCGHSDPARLTSRVAGVLAGHLGKTNGKEKSTRVNLVTGAAARGTLENCPLKNARILEGPDSLARCLQRSGLAIVSGGITMFESMCLGLPVIVVPQHAEQAINAGKFAARGALLAAPLPEQGDFSGQLSELIGRVLAERKLREQLSSAALALVDGHGTSRFLKTLLSEAGLITWKKTETPGKEKFA